jgi:hypothetical protein
MPGQILFVAAALFFMGIGFYLAHHILGTLILVILATVAGILGGVTWSLDSSGDARFS